MIADKELKYYSKLKFGEINWANSSSITQRFAVEIYELRAKLEIARRHFHEIVINSESMGKDFPILTAKAALEKTK